MRAGIALSIALADLLQDVVRLRQVFAVRALALDQVRHGIEPQAIDAHVEPELHDLEHRVHDRRVVVVQIGLVREEAMPVVLACATASHVQFDVSVSVKMIRASGKCLVGVAPDVEVALGRSGGACRAAWNQGCWSDV